MDLTEIRTALDEAFAKYKGDLDALRVNVQDLGQRFAGLSEARGGGIRGGESLGALLVKHDALAQFRAGARSVRAEIPDLDVKAALLSSVADAAGGYPVPPQQVLPAPLRPPRFWTALASTPTGSNALQIIDMTATGGAAATPEGQTKPEMTNTASPRLVPVDTIAVHKTLSLQLFEDVPALQAFLQAELSESCHDAMDMSCVRALQATSTAYVPATGGTVIDAVLDVIGAIYTAGGNGVVIGLSPGDWISMLTAKDNNNSYLVNPLQGLINGVAGATIAPTNAVAPGEFVAAASPAGAFVALRKGLSFEWSREHATNFTQNLITFLTELRAATVVQQARLVYTGPLVPPPPPLAAKARPAA